MCTKFLRKLRKQQIYEQALPIAPSVYQDDDALWRPNADRAMRKPTYTFHLSLWVDLVDLVVQAFGLTIKLESVRATVLKRSIIP